MRTSISLIALVAAFLSGALAPPAMAAPGQAPAPSGLEDALESVSGAFVAGTPVEEALPDKRLWELGMLLGPESLAELKGLRKRVLSLQKAALPLKPSMPAKDRAGIEKSVESLGRSFHLDGPALSRAKKTYLPPEPDARRPPEGGNGSPGAVPSDKDLEAMKQASASLGSGIQKGGLLAQKTASLLQGNREDVLDAVGPLRPPSSSLKPAVCELQPARQLPKDFYVTAAQPPGPMKKGPAEKAWRADYARSMEAYQSRWAGKARAIADAGIKHVEEARKPGASLKDKAYHYSAAAGLAVQEGVTKLVGLDKGAWTTAATVAAVTVAAAITVAAVAPAAVAAAGISGLVTTSTIAAGKWGLTAGVMQAAAAGITTYFAPLAVRDLVEKPSPKTGIMAAVSLLPVPGTALVTKAVSSSAAAHKVVVKAAEEGTRYGWTAAYRLAAHRAVHATAHVLTDISAHKAADTASTALESAAH